MTLFGSLVALLPYSGICLAMACHVLLDFKLTIFATFGRASCSSSTRLIHWTSEAISDWARMSCRDLLMSC